MIAKAYQYLTKAFEWFSENKGTTLVSIVILYSLFNQDETFAAVMYASILYSFILIHSVVKSKNSKRDREALDLEAPKLLDRLINESFDEVVVFDPTYNGKNKKVYITSQDEIEIQRKMVDNISKKLSPAIYDKLETYYGKNYIAEAIGNKIYLSITAFAIERNTPVDDGKIKSKKPDTKNILDSLL